MPRPQRARRAPPTRTKEAPRSAAAAAAEPSSDNDGHAEPRGRTRSTRSSGARLSAAEQLSVRAASNSRNAALDRLANEDMTTSSGNTLEDRGSESPVEVGRREIETPAQRRDTTGLDLADDDVFGDLDDSFEDASKLDAPRSAETTSLSLSSFKPRSRQSSIIGRNDPPIRPSSRGGNTPSVSSTFNIGAFRRRAREPSILGTSRKARPDTTTTTATTQHSDLESEDDFNPEAVSTPLNRRRTRSSQHVESEVAQKEPAQSTSRKRKSEEVHRDLERPEKASRIESDAGLDDGSDSELSSLPSPQHTPAPLLRRPVTPINQEEIIAPPASSGSESEGEIWPDIHALAKRRRRPSITTPFRADHMSDVSSPPSLTHSPNNADIRGRKSHARHHASPKMTTADLASLLPKRRYKKDRSSHGQDSDNEVDNSGLGQDDDELTHLDAKAARRRKGSRPPSRAASLRSASRSGRANQGAPQSKQTPTATRHSTRSKSQARRSSDKENQSDVESEEEESGFVPMPDDTFGTMTGQTVDIVSSDELKKATRKFKEVDQWQLEYEEVVPTSSPQGAR